MYQNKKRRTLDHDIYFGDTSNNYIGETDVVDAYFSEVNRMDVLGWDKMSKRHMHYQKVRASFNNAFNKSDIVKKTIKNAENTSRYFKPSKQNNEQYEFTYTYIAVSNVMRKLEDIMREISKTPKHKRKKLKKKIKALYGMNIKRFEKEASTLIKKYHELINEKNEITENYVRLVINIANRFKHNYSPTMNFEDMIQEGNIGLLKTIDSFDINNNVQFQSYCFNGIVNQIKRSLTAKNWIIKLPEDIIKNGYIITKIRKRLTKILNRKPTEQEIVDVAKIDIDPDEVRTTLDILHKFTMLNSLDALIQTTEYNEDGDKGDISVMNIYDADGSGESFEERESIRDTIIVIENMVDKIFGKLNISGIEREVAKRKLGLIDGVVFSDDMIMKELNLNKEEYDNIINNIRQQYTRKEYTA